MDRLWVGIDAGKEHHHAAAVDDTGRVVWSMRVANDQDRIGEVIARATAGGAAVRWAVDLIGCETAPAWSRSYP